MSPSASVSHLLGAVMHRVVNDRGLVLCLARGPVGIGTNDLGRIGPDLPVRGRDDPYFVKQSQRFDFVKLLKQNAGRRRTLPISEVDLNRAGASCFYECECRLCSLKTAGRSETQIINAVYFGINTVSMMCMTPLVHSRSASFTSASFIFTP